MQNQEETILLPENLIEVLSVEAREGLLFLCLIEENIELVFLSELVKSPEAIDELISLPLVNSDSKSIGIEENFLASLLKKFKWSEKVKAAEILAHYFENKSVDNEQLGDLWLISGQKNKAKAVFLRAVNIYKSNQLFQQIIRVGEKLLNLGNLNEWEEIEVIQSLISGHECCGELSQVIQNRKRLIEKPAIQEQEFEYASLLRALAIDYSKQGDWNLYKKFREEAALIFRKIKSFQDSSGEYMALAIKLLDELNLIKALAYSEEALKDAHLAQQVELISKSMSIKSYILSMEGNYKEGQKLAEEALQLALRNNLLETAAYVYRKLAGTYEYASDFEQAKVVYNKAIHFCETESLDVQVQMCYSCLSWIFLRLGEWKKAIDVCTSLIKDSAINDPSKSTAHCVIAIIKSLRGEIRAAEKHTLAGIFLAQKEQFMLMYHLLHLPMAKINELKENPEGAKEWYCKIIDEWHQTGEKHDVLMSLMDAAMFFMEQKDQVSLKKCLKIFSYICKETGNKEALGCLEYGLGLDALLNGHPPAAISRLTEAKKYLEPLNIPYQLILVEYHLALAYLSNGESEKEQHLLRSMLPQAKKMGLSPMISKINKLIEDVATQDVISQDILTKRQLDVLQLLSEGLSNKEIADRLFLSPRTVGMHVQYIFEKFYCHNRTEAIKIGFDKGLIK